MSEVTTSQVICYGTNHCPSPDLAHASQVLQNLEPRVQEGLVSVTVNHAQLNVVLRQLMLVMQSQIHVTETFTAQWKAAMADLNTRCDGIQAEVAGLKEQLPAKLADFKVEMGATINHAIQQSEQRMEEGIEEVIADVNHALDEANHNVVSEMQRMAVTNSTAANNASGPWQQDGGPNVGSTPPPAGPAVMVKSVREEEPVPRWEVSHIHSHRERPGNAPPPAADPPLTRPREAGKAELQAEMKSAAPRAGDSGAAEHYTTAETPMAASQKLSVPEPSESAAAAPWLLNVSQLLAARAGRPATPAYGPNDIIPNIAEKADVTWVTQQLKGKVNTAAFEAQASCIDELYRIATGLSSTLERLAAAVTAATGGQVLQDAVELRMENLTNEILRLDKVKADRGDLSQWLDKALADALLTDVTNPCLSCSRTAGMARLAASRRTQGFPPSTMFMSSLQVTSAPAGGAGEAGQGKKTQHPTPNLNSRTRKKLSHLQGWLHTRAEEERHRHTAALAEGHDSPMGSGPDPVKVDAPPADPTEASFLSDAHVSIPLNHSSPSPAGRWARGWDADSMAPAGADSAPLEHSTLPTAVEDDGPLAPWDSTAHLRPGDARTPRSRQASQARKRVPSLSLKSVQLP
eukprot:GGOE01004769.1.p1 GENE.GGOE01004769.1~~GGOE01004769.1.p1  ORF type:complete len:633 (+),score=159.81 GGOE01004769.1:63-1961(+)